VSSVVLGPGLRRCSKCGLVFADGSIEWAVASGDQKREFLFPLKLRVALVAEIIIGVGFLFLGDRAGFGWKIAAGFAGLAIIPVILHFAQCRLEIRQSNVRYNRRQMELAGYDVGPGSEALKR
jgi:hypothetical protein